MGEWRTTRLDDVVEIFDGPHATPPKADSGAIFLGISNLSSGRLNLSATEHVSESDLARWTRRVTPCPGDLVFSYETRLGEAALIPSGFRGCLGRRMGLLRARAGRVDPVFLLYSYLSPSFQETIRERTVRGSTVDRIPLIEMGSWPIQLPELDVQRSIAATLKSLDDKIDLNRRMNETLEAMARALFKSWFVDFDPVRAKAEGRAPAGMGAATAALFPNRLVETAEGEVPEGWRVEPLDRAATFLNGLALQRFPPTGSTSLPVIKIAEMKNGVTPKSDRASPDIPPQYVVNDGDVLFSWSGSLAVVVWTGGRGALNQHLFKVTSERFPRWFFVGWLREHLAEFREIAAGKATTMGHIQRHHLTDARVVVPHSDVLKAAHGVMEPLLERVVLNDLESHSLVQLRDSLLPRLLSGEVRVRDDGAAEAA